uniref:F-box domain-containing protein n=1 Tax=Meloidogyne incognita TaxID=6306 RepID=A0A914N989_MELIC
MNPSSSTAHILAELTLGEREKVLSERYLCERDNLISKFMAWTEQDQTDFCKHLLQRMCHHQHGQIDQFLGPMLKRDFISLLPTGLAENVLQLLDAQSLYACELVSKEWHKVIANGMLWRKFFERKFRSDQLWQGLANKRGWLVIILFLFITSVISIFIKMILNSNILSFSFRICLDVNYGQVRLQRH